MLGVIKRLRWNFKFGIAITINFLFLGGLSFNKIINIAKSDFNQFIKKRNHFLNILLGVYFLILSDFN